MDLGTDRLGFGYSGITFICNNSYFMSFSCRFGGTGKKGNNKQFDTYGAPFGLNDKIGCYIDLDNFNVGFSKNGIKRNLYIYKTLLGFWYFVYDERIIIIK